MLLGLVMDRRWCKDLRLHALLFASAVFAVLTPLIANAGAHLAPPGFPLLGMLMAAPLTAAVSQAGLWSQTFLLTGLLLDALNRRRPTWLLGSQHWSSGLKKGAMFSGVFMLVVQVVAAVRMTPAIPSALVHHPLLAGAMLGALLFPIVRTIMESFDGSTSFVGRLSGHFINPMGYLRGAVTGAGFALAFTSDLTWQTSWHRSGFGLLTGALAYAGVDVARDFFSITRGLRTRLQSWRVYLLGAALGGVVGGSLAWYLDGAQITVITAKFFKYAAIHYPSDGIMAEDYIIYPLFSKWGMTNLGTLTGGVRLLYNESLSGVINWSLAAPLFSINLLLLTALFQRSFRPLKELIAGRGIVEVMEQLVRVLRWGLWMAPVIYTFLRMSPDPAWYNQDGAGRSVLATFKSFTLSPENFRAWSLEVFLGLLAYDWLRILIWFDHMGLRVATLVNLSFIGGDALDERAARFLGHSSRTRCIPEGIRRFATWAPLLIPFYIPRGAEWDQVWVGAEKIHAAHANLLPAVQSLLTFYAFALAGIVVMAVVMRLMARSKWNREEHAPRADKKSFIISNGIHTLEMHADGRSQSRTLRQTGNRDEIVITRHSNDALQPCGKCFHLRDADSAHAGSHSCLLIGPQSDGCVITRDSPARLRLMNQCDGLRVEVEVIIDERDAVELWTVRIINLQDRARSLELTSYQELALTAAAVLLRQPAFNALHVGTCFVPPLNAIFSHNRLLKDSHRGPTQETAFHAVKTASSVKLVAYEDSRTRFLGAGTVSEPAALHGAMRSPDDDGMLYTFDPAASLRVLVNLAPNESVEVCFADGYALTANEAARLIAKHLEIEKPDDAVMQRVLSKQRELLDKPSLHVSESPYSYSDDGTELRMDWKTPRPWTHLLANALGQGAIVSNDGAIFSFARNSQQNSLTPFHMGTVPAQTLGQTIYVLNEETGEVDTPTFLPHRRTDASHEITYGAGYAVFQKRRESLEMEMTVFVPPDATVEVRLLKLRNRSDKPMRLRVVPYFEITLAEVPEDSVGKMIVDQSAADGALFFSYPDNPFVKGWAFVATDLVCQKKETCRAHFFGGNHHGMTLPYFVEHGEPDKTQADDDRRIASFMGVAEVPPQGEVSITMALGFTDTLQEAAALSLAYRSAAVAETALQATKRHWSEALSVLRIETNDTAFDHFVNHWLPYQILTARLWARTGPEQRSGAFGFRDQLQDVPPMVFLQPGIARSQILLHAAQQFMEGDVMAWWHPSPEGGTGLGARTHASDIHLWLPYVVCHYVEATGDVAILDEVIPFLESQPIPHGEEGHVFAPRPSGESATLFEHCLRATEFTLQRMGSHGLPLLGTGDWNDGLNAAGSRGKGESVWLGFFLHDVLRRCAALCEKQNHPDSKARYLSEADGLRSALDAMWRDDRYVRVISDRGQEMTFADALTASWPVLSGAVNFERGLTAVESALSSLEKDNLVLLLHPPFTGASQPYPGRIIDYPPGVRENGGQYSHGASWFVDALVQLADMAAAKGNQDEAARLRHRAMEVWFKVSPFDNFTLDALYRYGLPPHQQAADVYSGPGREGRGGWSWYTGAAARMLSAAYAMLGLRMANGEITLQRDAINTQGRIQLKRVTHRGRQIEPRD